MTCGNASEFSSKCGLNFAGGSLERGNDSEVIASPKSDLQERELVYANFRQIASHEIVTLDYS